MSRNVELQHMRGVDANKPTLNAGELYVSSDSQRIWAGATPVSFSPTVAAIDLTAQSAAISATTILTPAVAGLYELTFYLKSTTAASTSSTLGPVTVTWKDGTDNTSMSVEVGLLYSAPGGAGSMLWSNTVNGITEIWSGNLVLYAAAGTAITYAIGYASSGGTSMKYEVHIRAAIV